jgi:hypothetical protein
MRQAEDLRLYRAIATMDKKAPLPKRLANQRPTWTKAAALAQVCCGSSRAGWNRWKSGDGVKTREVITSPSTRSLIDR